MNQVLLVTICLAVFPYQGSSTILKSGRINDYEVVYPQKIYALPIYALRPEQNIKYEDTMRYEFKVNGKPVVLHLEKNKGLFSKDYTETHYSPDGREITTSPQVEDHCYYHGRIQNDTDSTAVISICDGLEGFFKHQGKTYLIEPLKLSGSEAHAVSKYESVEKEDETPKTCGVTHSTGKSDGPIKRTSQILSTPEEEEEYMKAKKFIKLYIVADNVMFRKYSFNRTAIRLRVFYMINYINLVYKALNIHVACIGLEIWSDRDRFVVNASEDHNLYSFAAWRKTYLLNQKKNDNAQLLTGVNFSGGTVGYAFTGRMCSTRRSLGVIQDHNKEALFVAATMAHEMGHNLGMDHDANSCTCKKGPCIMAASEGEGLPLEFSTCSLWDHQMYLMKKTPQCILNKPLSTDIVQNAVCGNNFVEDGEECDCGSPEECENECCNATDCKLKPEAVCAEGACCEECQLKKAGAVCRAVKDDCDSPELCTGQSAECPMDRFQKNGHPCQNNLGYCYRGNCPTLANQCIVFWGPDAEVAPDECFENNQKGDEYGHCTNENDTNIPCEPKDIKCGRFYCTGGTEKPSDGEKISFGSCKGSYSEILEDLGMVDPGTKCGEEKVCSFGQCVDAKTVFG